MDSLEQPIQWKMDMRIRTWNIRSLYRASSLKRMNLGETRWEGVEWIHLAQDRDQWQAPCEHSNESLVP